MLRSPRWLVAVTLLAGCHDAPTEDATCRCTPANHALTKAADGTPIDGASLLARLREHRREVAAHRTPRDIKVLDDQLRFEIANFCQPCGEWVGDRMTIEELYPLDRLDDAAGAVCMGLQLRDGTTSYGSARPAACR
jgi:hypothetical protein